MRTGYRTELENCAANIEDSLKALESELCKGEDQADKLNPLVENADVHLKAYIAALRAIKPAVA